MRGLVAADARVLPDPKPSVLLDRGAADSGIEIVAAFSTADSDPAAVKSDLIRAAKAAFAAAPNGAGSRRDAE